MTLDEAINHAEEEAIEQDKLCKRYDDASGYTRSHNKDIRTTDAKRCEECAEEHRQLAVWLKDYKRLIEQTKRNSMHLNKIIMLLHEETGCAISECQKAVDIAMQYIRLRNPVAGDNIDSFVPSEYELVKKGNLLSYHGRLSDMDVLEKQMNDGWIPVSERLPELDGDYLLFGKVVEDDTEDIFIGTYDACVEKFGYWENYYDRNTLGFLDSELIEYNKVIAWMPLPEPYTAESEEV